MGSVVLFHRRDERVGRPYEPGTRTYDPTWEHPEFSEDDRPPWQESARLIFEISAALWLLILLSVVW